MKRKFLLLATVLLFSISALRGTPVDVENSIDETYGSGERDTKLDENVSNEVSGHGGPSLCSIITDICEDRDIHSTLEKRLLQISDAGYGGRVRGASEMARSSLARKLFGIAGPGKRNMDIADKSHMDTGSLCVFSQLCSRPDGETLVRSAIDRHCSISGRQPRGTYAITDAGYGSRVNEAADLAKSTLGRHVFGVFGPGKRDGTSMYDVTPLCELGFRRTRRALDFGYGSRVDAGSRYAQSAISHQVFGPEGPGKRTSGTLDVAKRPLGVDFGYGSRVNSGSRLAKSYVLSGLYGSYGPGK